MYKVRFHLGRGENYMKWQVKDFAGSVEYYDPEKTNFILFNCTLKNNKKVAKEIYQGSNKTVCAWILCEKIIFEPCVVEGKEIRYNPRKNPFWTDGSIDLDNKKFRIIQSRSRKLFAQE